MRNLSKMELKLIQGGNAHLPMNSKYRKKSNCLGEAQSLLSRGIVTGMTELEIGKEIFAHAVAYYSASTLSSIPGLGSSIKNYLISHAQVVDIDDGGDTAVRKAGYNVIWAFTGEQI